MASPAVDQLSGGGEEVRGMNLPYPFCSNLPYLFQTYPILTLSFLSKLTLAFFHVRGELTLYFFLTYPILFGVRRANLPYPFSKLTLAFSTCAVNLPYPF